MSRKDDNWQFVPIAGHDHFGLAYVLWSCFSETGINDDVD